jgi:hypothetical protein
MMTREEIEGIFQDKLNRARSRSFTIEFHTNQIIKDAADVCLEACKRARIERDAALEKLEQEEEFNLIEDKREEEEKPRWPEKEEMEK